MTNEYIRRQDAVDALAKTMSTPATPDGVGEFDHEIHIADEAFADAIRIIESIKPADVVPVVRCDDCEYYGSRRWCELHSSVFNDDAFCSYGEKREG